MCLPLATDLDLYLDTFVDVLCSPLIIDPKLQEISVLEFTCWALRVRSAEADMVEERARAALCVAYEKLATGLDPDLSVGSADDLALEGELVRPESVRSRQTEP